MISTMLVPHSAGIYCFLNLANNKRYVGSAADLRQRMYGHLSCLRRDAGTNLYFQNAWNKHGEAGFEFVVLEECPRDQLIEREQFYIDFFKAAERSHGYNRSPKANAGSHSPESKEKFRRSIRAKYEAGYVNHFKGKTHSKDTKDKIGAHKRGKTYEELYGEERGKQLRQGNSRPGASNPMYGTHRAGNQNPMFGTKRAWLFNPRTEELLSLTNPTDSDILFYTAQGWRRGRKGGYKGKNSKPVLQIALDGQVVKRFERLMDAAASTGTVASNISQCLNGKRRSAAGYQWRFAA